MRYFPVELDVTAADRFERPQLAVRVAIFFVLFYLGVSLGWIFAVLYIGLPVVAAILISNRGGERYLSEAAHPLARLLRWFIAFNAYMLMLIDRFPVREPYGPLELEVYPTGSPTTALSLLKLLSSIPLALILIALSIPAALLWIVAAVWVLVDERYPAFIYHYQRGLLRFEARFLTYHLSLGQAYPPLSFDTGREVAAPLAVARPPEQRQPEPQAEAR